LENLIGDGMMITRLALDAAALRHEAIASNIANINSAGYQPLRVNFEEQLTAAGGAGADAAKLRGVEPFLEQEPARGELTPQVALDMEIVKLNVNTLHYQTLLRAASRYVSIMNIAMNDGRR
jgi:flagellar basal-body rod protein FlgB